MFKINKVYNKRAMAFCPYHKSQKGSADLDITLEGEYAGYWRCWGCEKSGKITDQELAQLRSMRTEKVKTGPVDLDWNGINQVYKSDRRKSGVQSPLKVSHLTMMCLGWGWDGKAHTFAERNARDEIIGILRRFPNGNKGVVSGSKRGITVPRINFCPSKTLYITEGLSDLSVILECELQGIARPNSNSCVKETVEWADSHLFSGHIIIVADNDDAGQDGAGWLANRLGCNVITPWDYGNDLYDMYLAIGKDRVKEWILDN